MARGRWRALGINRYGSILFSVLSKNHIFLSTKWQGGSEVSILPLLLILKCVFQSKVREWISDSKPEWDVRTAVNKTQSCFVLNRLKILRSQTFDGPILNYMLHGLRSWDGSLVKTQCSESLFAYNSQKIKVWRSDSLLRHIS